MKKCRVLTWQSFASLLIHFFFLVLAPISWSATLTDENANKTSPEVIERAKKGESQELFVILEHKEIREKEKEKRKARNLPFNDDKLQRETNLEFDKLKKSVFPNGRLGDVYIIDDHSNVPIVQVKVPSYEGLIRLLSHPKVVRVNPNQRYKPAISESLPLINQPAAFIAGKVGAGTKIAIIDTGVNVRSELFSTNGTWPACVPPGGDKNYWGGDPIGTGKCRIANAESFTNTKFEWETWLADHGTVVAGIARKVAPEAKIAALQVMYTNAYGGRSSDVVFISRALRWVIDNVNSSADKIVAVNMSLDSVPGLLYTEECTNHTFHPYFDTLHALGVVPVVASGNTQSSIGISEPACVPGAVRVGAVYDKNISYPQEWAFENESGIVVKRCQDPVAKVDHVPCGSNSNKLITLFAPGAYINLGNVGGSGGGGGTSMAAPHVAGAVAALRASNAFPNDNTLTTISRMVNNGVTVTDSRNGISRKRLDLHAALTQNTVPYVPPEPNVTTILTPPVLHYLLLGL